VAPSRISLVAHKKESSSSLVSHSSPPPRAATSASPSGGAAQPGGWRPHSSLPGQSPSCSDGGHRDKERVRRPFLRIVALPYRNKNWGFFLHRVSEFSGIWTWSLQLDHQLGPVWFPLLNLS